MNYKAVREKLFTIKERLQKYKYLKNLFEERVGYKPDFENPTTFNEKINWKKINDRNPLLPITADKILVRDYILKKFGSKTAEDILIPILYKSKEPELIPFSDFKTGFVVKANHGSGTNILVDNESKISKKDIIINCNQWLNESYGYDKAEWLYQRIDPKILVEKLMKDNEGNIPNDYKFYVFHGKCKYVHVDFDRFENHTRSFFDPNSWSLLPISLKFDSGKSVKKPKRLNEMVKIAEEIGEDFDFVRVDLYEIDGSVFFSEITHYPGSGMEKFIPAEYDKIFGSKWRLDKSYWK